jgi:hypothetical protein
VKRTNTTLEMAPSKKCPIEQIAQGKNPEATPLVLIHDGGGTILSYRALGPMECDVYAISDPSFEKGTPWKGGLREMAETYIELIKEKVPSQQILLGGMFVSLSSSNSRVTMTDINYQAGPLVDLFLLKSPAY